MKSQQRQTSQKVLVGISGGLASAVTAALLKTQGYQVLGIHFDFRSRETKDFESRCAGADETSRSDRAKKICQKLEIPLETLSVANLYRDRVIDPALHGTLQSKAVNPCIACHRDIKLRTLALAADSKGCDWIATGHFAQVVQDPTQKSARIYQGLDPELDQSYFLMSTDQKVLSRTMMPVGALPFSMVTRLAHELKLPEIDPNILIQTGSTTQNEREPCFVNTEKYIQFVEAHSARSLRLGGVIKKTDGKLMGEHRGLYLYHIGQSKGLPLSVKEKDAKEEYVVVGFDPKGHSIIVGYEKQLFHRAAIATETNWIRPINGLKGMSCQARISPSAKDAVSCWVTPFENGGSHLEFSTPQRCLARGQAVAFYDSNELIGGGVLSKVFA